MESGKRLLGTQEYPLFTDAWITGEVQHGPYYFLNTVSMGRSWPVQPSIVLRWDSYEDFSLPDMSKTDVARYHGGSPPEEVAALCSLALGVRLRAGGMTRWFEPGADPKGKPHAGGGHEAMGILIRNPVGWVLPSAGEGTHSLDELGILGTLPKLRASDATALVKAARLYQDALWLVESETPLAWLMLVSALETAAHHWGRRIKEDPVARLQASKPQLYEYLKARLEHCALAEVAKQMADSLGATSKFIKFALGFLPPPPAKCPPKGFQLSWDRSDMEGVIRKIYDYRSKALHAGIPFPFPMCTPPLRHLDWLAPAEVPVGLSTSAVGGTWLASDTPVIFHTFEYIARHALLTWWKGYIREEEDGGLGQK
jgi:hypothetical protein